MKRRDAIRQTFGGALALTGAAATLPSCETSDSGSPDEHSASGMPMADFADQIGVTTDGFDAQRVRGELTLENLPAFLNRESGLQLIDVNTHWFTSFKRSYVETCRDLAAKSGCVYTNLKVDHRLGDLYSGDGEFAGQAMAEGQQMIDVANWLGAKWVRFNLPKPQTLAGDLSAHRRLAEFAAERSIQLVVENSGWMRARADSISLALAAIGGNSAPGPDTGNWNDEVRDEGLAQSFPGAVTCDFKVFAIDADGHHAKYDLRRCFDIGRRAGYRGPWLLDHRHEDSSALVHDLLLLRDQLRGWMSEAAVGDDSPKK